MSPQESEFYKDVGEEIFFSLTANNFSPLVKKSVIPIS